MLLAACGGDSPQALVKSAKDYLAKGDGSAAVIQLRNALQKAPDDAEARYLLGTVLTERRDPAGAVKELRRALELGYPADQVVPTLARALVNDGDAKELIAEFGNTTLGTPEAQAALKTTLGNALLSLDNPQDAEAAFNAALAAKADYADALLGLATLRAASGDLEGTKKIVDAVLAQPTSAAGGVAVQSPTARRRKPTRGGTRRPGEATGGEARLSGKLAISSLHC